MIFESDPEKEAANVEKHGVDFSTVGIVFVDPHCLIVANEEHSTPDEPRFYAIGWDGRGVLTVRFTRRDDAVRIIGAGYWRKQRRAYENNKTKS